jgi:hypothetical protein
MVENLGLTSNKGGESQAVVLSHESLEVQEIAAWGDRKQFD